MKNHFNYSVLFVCAAFIFTCCGSRNSQKTVSSKSENDTSIGIINYDTAIPAVSSSDQNGITPSDIALSSEGTDFSFIYATSQKWHGGVKGSGSGVNYEICLLSFCSSSSLIIDQVWIGQSVHTASASRKFPKSSSDGFSTNDTIYLYVNDYIKSPDKIDQAENIDGQSKEGTETKQNTPPPYAYVGEALIGYKINGERKYKEIGKITIKPPLFYP